jgi:hypothetical protein
MHNAHAVDMDVYGAFQLCAIGVLTAPPTVRLSKTYWNQVQGRNVIFIWTGLILAGRLFPSFDKRVANTDKGLLSLTVEFYRTTSSPCKGLAPGDKFPYGMDNACGLICSVSDGPRSSMRQGSANNIYVIPIPRKITFGMGTLFAAACCVPALLSLVSIYNKIVQTNKKKQHQDHGKDEIAEDDPERIDRTNKLIRGLLSVVEIPVFSGAVLALVILGELNFWDTQVYFMTERIAAIGQWAPIAGTGLAVVGALLLRVAEILQPGQQQMEEESAGIFLDDDKRRPTIEIDHVEEEAATVEARYSSGDDAIHQETVALPEQACTKPDTAHVEEAITSSSSETDPREYLNHTDTLASTRSRRDAGRSRFAALVAKATRNPALTRDELSFQAAKKVMPEIPGEINRNPFLREQSEHFGQHRSSFGNSNAPSIYEGSDLSHSRDASPFRSPRSVSTLPTPSSATSPTGLTFAEGSSAGRPSYLQRDRTSSEPFGSANTSPVRRTQTLQVPSPSRSRFQ